VFCKVGCDFTEYWLSHINSLCEQSSPRSR